MVPSLDQTTSESYAWAYPGCPIRILLSLKVIEQLQAEVSQSATSPCEIGGLLVRSKQSEPDITRIVDFIPLQTDRKASEPRFKLPSESLAEAIARCPSDLKIAGYYRTDADRSVHLRPDDIETIQQWFKDPANVFLVIASDPARVTAGFFFWEKGTVAANSSLTFPFGAAKLVSEGWPIEADPPGKETEGALPGILRKASDFSRRLSLPMKVGLAGALFALIIGIRLLSWNRSSSEAKAPAASLGLQVIREGTKFLVRWNPSAPAIARAKDANLVIWDGSRQAWDGSSAPIYMPLTAAQLRAGSAVYISFSLTDQVKFRLDAAGPSGNGATESAVSVSPSPENSPLSPPPSLPPINPYVPYEPRRTTAAIIRPVQKNFVPPQTAPPVSDPVSNQGETAAVPEPPKISAEPVVPPVLTPSAGAPVAQSAVPSAVQPATVAPPDGLSNRGVVTITSEPSGARVEINGVANGVTPVTLQVSPVGVGFTVSLTKSGFMKWTVQSFSAAQPFSLHAQLRMNPK